MEMFSKLSGRKGFTARLYFVILWDGICVRFCSHGDCRRRIVRLGKRFGSKTSQYLFMQYRRFGLRYAGRGMFRKIVSFLLCGCLVAGLCGCGWVGEMEENTAAGDVQELQARGNGISGQDAFKLLPEAELDYLVPEQYPGIWGSLAG